MRNVFKYRIRSHKDGVVSMYIKFDESALDSFLAYFRVKQRQSPSMSVEEMRRKGDEYLEHLRLVAAKQFDKVFPDSGCHRKAISATLRALRDRYPNLSYEHVKTLLRRSGRLKGTRL